MPRSVCFADCGSTVQAQQDNGASMAAGMDADMDADVDALVDMHDQETEHGTALSMEDMLCQKNSQPCFTPEAAAAGNALASSESISIKV